MAKEAYTRPDGTQVYYGSESDVSLKSADEQQQRRKPRTLFARILRVLFLIIQSLLLILGLAIIIIASLGWKKMHDLQLDSDPAIKHIPMFALIIGIAILLMAMIAMGAAANRRRRLGFVYIVVAAALIGGQIYLVIRLAKLVANMHAYVSAKWDAVQPTSRLALETWKQCCGFDNSGDRPQSPCPLQADNATPVATGCWDTLKDKVVQFRDIAVKVLIGSIITHFVMIVVMLIILFL
jgi:hypothetical protein